MAALRKTCILIKKSAEDQLTTMPQITLAVCSNDPQSVMKHFIPSLGQLSPSDRSLVVLNMEADAPDIDRYVQEWRTRNVSVIIAAPQGLSFCRNVAIAHSPTRYLTFVDDDVRITTAAIEAIRAAFAEGANVVGVRLVPDPNLALNRWYISEGQFHYVGLHRPGTAGTTWGACMAIDVFFVRTMNIAFRSDLGRQNGKLLSGEDTTFLSQMRKCGATERFIDHAEVTHYVREDRLSMHRMISRAFWQGRTESVRGSRLQGALKEWKRNITGSHCDSLRGVMLAVLYEVFVVAGIAVESASAALKSVEAALSRIAKRVSVNRSSQAARSTKARLVIFDSSLVAHGSLPSGLTDRRTPSLIRRSIARVTPGITTAFDHKGRSCGK